MRWLSNISFLSSSSTSSLRSSSSSSSCGGGGGGGVASPESQQQQQQQNKSTNGNLRRGGGSFGTRRKLTRPGKLRHLTDQTVAGISSHLLEASDGLKRWSSSDDQLQSASSSACSAIPQPLPLPELCRRRENSSDVDCRLPSPKTGPARGLEDRDRDGIGDGVSGNTGIRR